MKYRTAELATGIFFLIFSAVYFFYLTPNFITETMRDVQQQKIPWTLRPEMLPQLTISAFAVLSVVLVSDALKTDKEKPFDLHLGSTLKLVLIITLAFIYVYLLPLLGFLLITPVFLAVLITIFGVRNWKQIVGVSLGLPIFLEVSFYQLFQLILPEGELWK